MHSHPPSPIAIERVDSAESIRAFEAFPFISVRRGIASFAGLIQAAISIISTRLVDFVVKRRAMSAV